MPKTLANLMDKWRATRSFRRTGRSMKRAFDADGEYRWFLIRTVPLRDEMGNIVNGMERIPTSRIGNRRRKFEPRRLVKRVFALM